MWPFSGEPKDPEARAAFNLAHMLKPIIPDIAPENIRFGDITVSGAQSGIGSVDMLEKILFGQKINEEDIRKEHTRPVQSTMIAIDHVNVDDKTLSYVTHFATNIMLMVSATGSTRKVDAVGLFVPFDKPWIIDRFSSLDKRMQTAARQCIAKHYHEFLATGKVKPDAIFGPPGFEDGNNVRRL